MKELKIDLRVALKQTLTPQLYQLLKLLQMPYLELEQTVRNELIKNPLLEEQKELEEEQETTPQLEQKLKKEVREIDWAEFFQGEYNYYYRPVQYLKEDIPEKVPVTQPSIRDRLLEQLHLNTGKDQTRIVGEYIIDSLNDEGFLDIDIKEISDVLNVSESMVLDTLRLVHTFDPPGVGSRNIEECLTIQLYQNGYEESSIEIKIAKDFLKEVGSKQFYKIRKQLRVSEMRVKEAVEIISSLNPKPFRGLGSSDIRYIVPDLIMKETEDGYEIMVNETTIPSLRINNYYKEILYEKESLLKEEKEFIRQKLNSALNLMRGLEERRRSILKVARFIVEKQKGFFEVGFSQLVPLTMQRVSEAVGLHESTISRIVQGKYIDTPRGLFELRFFFSGGISRENDVDISTRTVKERVKVLIEKEDKKHPLEDREIVEILDKEGIHIARRTVAKYRKQLILLPARLRKEY
ncbi:MAG: RNA polymerase factor sigma-54 [Candidatus Cloacimonadota bacterium]|nr:MAG: RNA polymerase factor sigma-54 [Candidatus Cloacimonadota bacterium]